MMLARIAALALALPLAATALPASAQEGIGGCGAAVAGDWMGEDAARARAAKLGYDIREIEVEDGCYEISAVDRTGVRVEALMNPVSGAILRDEVEFDD